jgi:hypothetical protein
LHILTFNSRDYSSDDVILRIQNFSPVQDVTIDLEKLFKHDYLSFVNIRKKSLNIVFDLPHGHSIHDYRPKIKAGNEIVFSMTANVMSKFGVSQNTQEEGVFLSDEALANAKKMQEKESRVTQGQRKILALDGAAVVLKPEQFTIPANSIVSFLVHIKLHETAFLDQMNKQKKMVTIEKPDELENDPIAVPIDQQQQEVPHEPVENQGQNDQQQQEIPQVQNDQQQQPQHEIQEDLGKWLENPKEEQVIPETKEEQSGGSIYILVLGVIIALVLCFLLRKRFSRAWSKVQRKKSGGPLVLPLVRGETVVTLETKSEFKKH